MKIVAVTQARVGSSRLPAKVLKEIGNKSLLEMHLERASQSKLIDKLVVATTNEPESDKILAIAKKMSLEVYQGSTDDVLDRFYQTVKILQPDYVVRVTSDCPLIDAVLIDDVIRFALHKDVDYVSNTLEPTFPDGQDVEVFKFSALEKAWIEANLPSEREHLTAYIWKNSTWFKKDLFTSANFESAHNYGSVRLTVDEQKDFETIETLIEVLGMHKGWRAYADYFQANASGMCNGNITRNEGYTKSLHSDK